MRKKVSTERNKEIKNNVKEQSQPSPAFPRSSLNCLNLNKEDNHLALSVSRHQFKCFVSSKQSLGW